MSSPMKGKALKPKRKVYIYGNYPNYRRYRFAQQHGMDVRLKRLQEALPISFGDVLKGSYCLDIGCNTGTLARDLVTHFEVEHVTGIDIDDELILRAKRETPSHQAQRFAFINEDYASSSTVASTKKFDAVFCLSVTKWIHLHGGDTAILRLLDRIGHDCRPGGLFILEPQVWESYRRKRNLSELTAENYRHLQLRPHEFVTYAQRTQGFNLIATIPPDENVVKGFQRTIYVLRKDTRACEGSLAPEPQLSGHMVLG